MANPPNPGSLEAARLGCDCPVNSNHKGVEEPDGGWIIRATCKVHGSAQGPGKTPDVLVHVRLGRWNRLRARLGAWVSGTTETPPDPRGDEPAPPEPPQPETDSAAALLLREIQGELGIPDEVAGQRDHPSQRNRKDVPHGE